ncbi:helix-turn-helix transcriptional regulator [Streptacidiphilus sp. BW17]|uniref:helix-turn-helix transcriptional regulator n=1 Tax=Streptacidiphilus sp. BW17 TaxID=3156274 RepID=UPI003511C539
MDGAIHHPLAYARIQQGWTKAELARRVRQAAVVRGLRSGVDRQRTWKWETGRAVPDRESQVLLAAVFGVDVNDVERHGWPDWLPGRDEPLPLGAPYTVQALREALRTAMDRRNFMTLGALALTGLAAQWATLEPGRLTTALAGKSTDATLVDWLEKTTAGLSTMPTEQRQYTARLLDAHLETVTDLIEHSRYTTRTGLRLHALAATLGTTCGWYRFDQGQHSAAGRFWTGALQSSHAAGDRDFGAGVISDFAYQAIWLNSPQLAGDLLGLALSRATHPTARSLLHLRRARAFAAMHSAAACQRELTAAERDLDVSASDPAPAWCGWMSPADLMVDSGQCFLDLGRTGEAQNRIREGIALLPRSRDKTRGIFLTYQARSLLQSGDVEEAAVAAGESLELANRIGAERSVSLLRDLSPQFTRHTKVGRVGSLMEDLRAS